MESKILFRETAVSPWFKAFPWAETEAWGGDQGELNSAMVG